MYESYGTYVNDEYVDNHDYDDDTDDGNDQKKDKLYCRWCCSHPDQTWPCQARPGQARPSQTPKILYVDLVLA